MTTALTAGSVSTGKGTPALRNLTVVGILGAQRCDVITVFWGANEGIADDVRTLIMLAWTYQGNPITKALGNWAFVTFLLT